jgi:hypothetical protein
LSVASRKSLSLVLRTPLTLWIHPGNPPPDASASMIMSAEPGHPLTKLPTDIWPRSRNQIYPSVFRGLEERLQRENAFR